MQCRCGHVLSDPRPRFCPQCGTETATLPVSTAAPQQERPQLQFDWRSHRALYITLGLILLGLLLGGAGGTEGFLSFVAVVLLVLDSQQYSWYSGLPVWLHRPRLGAIAAGLFVITTAFGAGMNPGFLFMMAGTWRFLKDAHARGELGPFDPRLLTYGWRMLLLIGMILAAFTFSVNWQPGYGTFGYSTTERIGNDKYYVYHPGQTFGGDNTATDMGITLLPSLLMAVAVGWAAWRGSGAVPKWFRFVPAALAVLMVIWALSNADFTAAESGIMKIDAEGAPLFLLLLLPFYVGALMLALGRQHWRRGA